MPPKMPSVSLQKQAHTGRRITVAWSLIKYPFSGAGLGGAVLSSELLAAVVVAAWPAGSEAAVRMVDSGARLWATPQPGRGRLPWRRNWTAGWLMGAYGGTPDGRAGPGGRLGL